MKILLSTSIFPNRIERTRGVYIKHIAQALAIRTKLKIVVPIPFLPSFLKLKQYVKYSKIPHRDCIDGLDVLHPRYVIVPKVFRFLHGIFLFLSTFNVYRKILKTGEQDIILSFWAFPDGFANVLVSKIFNRPIVIGVLGSDINHLTKYMIQRKMIAWTLNNASRVLSVSEDLKQKIVALGVSEQKVIVIPNGIESEKFSICDQREARKKLGLEYDKKIFICVSRLSSEKGIDALVNAISQIDSKAIECYIIGDGAEKNNLLQLREKLSLNAKVHFVGEKHHSEIPLWINAGDIIVLPSRTEGWPNVLMESFGCGKPVVASRVGGVPEIVTSENLGIMVPPDDPKSLSTALSKAIELEWDAEVIRERVKKRGWDTVADETYDVLHETHISCQ